MNTSKKIALNTTATYARSVISAGLALFSSRWVLNALGQTDFGLFSVVGSIILFITFLNTVLSNSAARYYAHSIGQGDVSVVRKWFNAALSIHCALAAILILFGWPTGEYIISKFLTIPVERIPACLWVFRLSLVSAFFSMISVPCIAMFTAKQRIAELAVWNMCISFMTFSLAWYLLRVQGDKLLFYAGGMVGIIVCIRSVQIIRAITGFSECRISLHEWFTISRVKEIASFAGWNLVGNTAALLRNQGSAILLNLNFGSTANAAYSIANQVSAQTSQLALALIRALSPEITTREGRGERQRMLSLAFRASKFGTILALLFAVPLIVEMEYVLKIWLVQPPEHTAILCQLILTTFIIDKLSTGNLLAVRAYGKIAAYQATVGGCLILTLPLAWLFLKLGAQPGSVGVAFIITASAATAGRVLWTRHFFHVTFTQWIKSVLVPCGIVGMASLLTAITPYYLLPQSFARLLCVLTGGILAALLTSWFFAFNRMERDFFYKNFQNFLAKIKQLVPQRKQ